MNRASGFAKRRLPERECSCKCPKRVATGSEGEELVHGGSHVESNSDRLSYLPGRWWALLNLEIRVLIFSRIELGLLRSFVRA